MKVLDAAKLTDITKMLSLSVMLTYTVWLFIHFIKTYLSVVIGFKTIFLQIVIGCPNARKRVVNRVVHDFKDAIFPGPYLIGSHL
jgi:hypothetical protein